jgi:hypothetical protein
VVHSAWCKAGSKTNISGMTGGALIPRDIPSVDNAMNKGVHAKSQCRWSRPSAPPIAGISCFGSVEIARIMLGKRQFGSLTDNSMATSIDRIGG